MRGAGGSTQFDIFPKFQNFIDNGPNQMFLFKESFFFFFRQHTDEQDMKRNDPAERVDCYRRQTAESPTSASVLDTTPAAPVAASHTIKLFLRKNFFSVLKTGHSVQYVPAILVSALTHSEFRNTVGFERSIWCFAL